MSTAPRPDGRPAGVSLAAARLRQARVYLLANPHASKSQAVMATGLSDSTIARARRDLVDEGILAPARNAPVEPVSPPEPVAAQPTEGAPSEDKSRPVKSTAKGNATPDHEAMRTLAEMVDTAVNSGDDESIQKMLLKQCLVFAFRPDLHPDTRMTASQMWGKLRDMAKAKDLGPGKPKTRVDAVLRLRDMLIAAGSEITIEAVHLAFDVKEAPDVQATGNEAVPPSGPPQDASPPGHTSDPAASNDLRQVNMGNSDGTGGSPGQQDYNLHGPEAGRESSPSDPRATPHPNAGSPWD